MAIYGLDILMTGPVGVHHKDVFIGQNLTGRQVGGYFDWYVHPGDLKNGKGL